jgi:CTP synthase (UTP-ammonia lyase)
MKSENEIVHRVKKLKHTADRYGCGFDNVCEVGVGGNCDPINRLLFLRAIEQLEWVLGRKVDYKKINWFQVGMKVFRRNRRLS